MNHSCLYLGHQWDREVRSFYSTYEGNEFFHYTICSRCGAINNLETYIQKLTKLEYRYTQPLWPYY